MRYRCPEDCAGISHAGVVLSRNEDGTFDADAEAAAALAPHGIVPAAEDAPRAKSKARDDDRRMLR